MTSKKIIGLILSFVMMIGLAMGVVNAQTAATLEVTPNVTIAAGSGGGFLINLTSAETVNARVEITIPEGFEITNYPTSADETIGDFIASVSVNGNLQTEQNIAVEFNQKITNLGFTITVKPTYSVEHNGVYDADVKYYYDGVNALNATCKIKTTNQTVSVGSGYYRVQQAPTITNFRNDKLAYYKYDPVIYTYSSSMTEHYRYKGITMTVPLEMNGECATPVPMIKDGEDYNELVEGTIYSFTTSLGQNYTVEYQKNYELKNSNSSTASYTGPVLIYSLDESSALATGAQTTIQFDNGVYLVFAAGQLEGTYRAEMREQINVTDKNDNVVSLWTTTKLSSYASIYLSFYDPSPGGSVYMTSSISSDMSLGTIVIPQKDTTTYAAKFTNNYGELNELTIEYTFPQGSGVTDATIYSTQSVFGYMKDVTVDYTTSKDRTERLEKSQITSNSFKLAPTLDEGEYITKLVVKYSNISANTQGSYGAVSKAVTQNALSVKMWNAENTVGRAYNIAKVTSVNGKAIAQSGNSLGYNYQKSDETYITTPDNDLTAIAVGDVITARITPGAWNYKGATYNPDIYTVVPKGYVYVDGSLEEKCGASHLYIKDAEYTITSSDRTLDGKEYTVYKLSYTDGKIRTGYSHLYMSFKVTDYIDMSSAQIKFPVALYIDNGADKYFEDTGSYFVSTYVNESSTIVSTPKNYVGPDIYDVDGDGDTVEIMSKPSSVPTVALNLSYVLVTDASVEIDESGEELSEDGAKYCSTGKYTSTIFNRLQGEVTNVNVVLTLDDLNNGFDVLMIGPAVMSEGCEGIITYSKDGVTYFTENEVTDWSKIRYIQYDMSEIAVGEINELSFPFEVDYSKLDAMYDSDELVTSVINGSVQYRTNTAISADAELPKVVLTAEPTNISGWVYIDNEVSKKDYENASITLLDENGSILAQAKSDCNGLFFFDVYKAGKYSVAVKLTEKDKAEEVYKVEPLYVVTLDDVTTNAHLNIPITTVDIPDYDDDIDLNSGYAYIFGYSDWIMGSDGPLLRCETSAMLHRLMRQNGKLGTFVYNESAPSFEDISGEWFQSGIEYMVNRGAFTEFEGKVYPKTEITRGEAFKLICLGLGFTDDNSLALSQYALILIDAGYVIGYDDGSIGTANPITRAEFCTIYNRIIGRSNKTTDIDGVEPVMLMTRDDKAAYELDYIIRYSDLEPDAWYYEEMVKATSAFTDGYIDVEKRGIRNNLDDYDA